MKRLKVAVLVMLMISASAISAQEAGEEVAKEITFGIKGGVNLASAYGDEFPEEGGRRLVGCGGVYMTYRIHEMFVVQPEILFSMMGWEIEGEGGKSGIDLAVKLNYVDFNVLAKLTIDTKTEFTPNVFAGPYIGVKASDSYEYTFASAITQAEQDTVTDNTDAQMATLKSMDVGLVFGGGVDYELSNGHSVILDIRYSLGLIDIFGSYEVTRPAGVEEVKPVWRNQAFSAMIGYAF